jgi:phage/plasmid primase-like uncharacterized protein
MVTVDGEVQVEQLKASGTSYSFTVSFSRDGHSLGQSQQSCSIKKLQDCTDQIGQDVTTAATLR